MPDRYDKLSDDQLDALLAQKQSRMASKYESLSDADLDRLIAQKRAESVPKFESALRGLAQSASFGFADELTARGESLFTGKPYDQALRESRAAYNKARDANPWSYMGGEVGGALATAVVPGAGALNAGRAATTMGKIGRLAAQGAISGTGFSEADSPAGIAWDATKGAGIGAVIGGITSGLTGMTARPVAEVVDTALVPTGMGLAPEGKSIARAAERIGVTPTKAMIANDYITKGLEQSLAVSPSVAGNMVRSGQEKAATGIRNAAGKILSERTDNTAFEIGETVVDSIKKKLLDRYEPIKRAYSDIAGSATEIALKDKSKGAVARNMSAYATEVFAPGTSQRAMIQELAGRLENATTLDQLKQIRTSLNRQVQSIDPRVRNGFGPIFQKLDRLERNSTLRAAIEATGNQADGQAIAQQLIGKTKDTNRAYRELMGDLWQLGDRSKISKSRTVTELIRDLDELSPEQVGAKIFRTNDQKLLGHVQKNFPEAFDMLRTQKMNEIYSKSMSGDQFSPNKFISQVEKLQPEVRQMLLGDKFGMYEDFKNVARSYPGPINPSGTSINQSFGNILNLPFQAQEMARLGLYKTGTLPIAAKFVEPTSKIAPLLTAPGAERAVSPGAAAPMAIDQFQELNRDSGTPAMQRKPNGARNDGPKLPRVDQYVAYQDRETEPVRRATLSALAGIDSVTGAPFRRTMSELISGDKPGAVGRVLSQFGNSKDAPTWEDLASQAGIENETIQKVVGVLGPFLEPNLPLGTAMGMAKKVGISAKEAQKVIDFQKALAESGGPKPVDRIAQMYGETGKLIGVAEDTLPKAGKEFIKESKMARAVKMLNDTGSTLDIPDDLMKEIYRDRLFSGQLNKIKDAIASGKEMGVRVEFDQPNHQMIVNGKRMEVPDALDALETERNSRKFSESFDKYAKKNLTYGNKPADVIEATGKMRARTGNGGPAEIIDSDAIEAKTDSLNKVIKDLRLNNGDPDLIDKLTQKRNSMWKFDDDVSSNKTRWAYEGLDNISDHLDGKLNFNRREAVRNPKVKEMLMQASSFKPGSKALEKLIKDIEKVLQKGGD